MIEEINNVFVPPLFPNGINRDKWLRLSAIEPVLNIGCGETDQFYGMYALHVDDWSGVTYQGLGYLKDGMLDCTKPFDGTLETIEKVRLNKLRIRLSNFMDKPFCLARAPDELSLFGIKYGQFKTCVLSEIIEHQNDPLNFILKCSDYVEKGGRVLVTVPDEEHWDKELNPFQNNSHKHYFNDELFAKLLKDTNMKIIQLIHTRPEWMPPGWVYFYAILEKE